MKRNLQLVLVAGVLWLTAIYLGLSRGPVSVSAQTGSNRQYHVTLNALPSSLTAPTPVEGGALTTSVNVDFIVIANTDSADHTVTVEDCTPTTPFAVFTGTTVTAGTTVGLPLGNIRFNGCFKWSASSTKVQGAVVGTR